MMLKNLVMNKNVAMAMLKTQKHSPTLLFGAGVVGVVGTVVLSSRATLRVGDILDETNKNLEMIASVDENHPKYEEYSEQDRTRDKAIVYTQTALKIGKLYLPAFALGVISIGCLTGSHHILSRRNVALSAAYAGLEKTFKEYRGRVIESIGEEKEAHIWQPMEKVDAVDPETGKKVKLEVKSATGGSPYKVLFDEFNKNWNPEVQYNQFFLQSQQNFANDKLRANGFLFLNEVHELLGLEKTKAGQIVGWVWNGDGDNYVSFGIFEDNNAGMLFATGQERSIWLDFNVDGPVLDILED